MRELVQEKQAITEQMAAMKDRLDEIDEEIFSLVKDRIKPQGSTTLEQDGIKLTVTIPMRASWNEDMLRQIAEKIRSHGDNPEDFIQYKLSVLETKYKNFPRPVQNLFEPARTIKPGKKQIKVVGNGA
jgi:hypothetical protein